VGIILLAAIALLLVLPSRIAARARTAGPPGRGGGLHCNRVRIAAALAFAGAAAFVAALFRPNVALIVAGTLRGRASVVAYGAAVALALLVNLMAAGGIGPLRRYLAATLEQTRAEAAYVYQYTAAAVAQGYGVPAAQAAALGVAVQAYSTLAMDDSRGL
jgi:hypothetical protein